MSEVTTQYGNGLIAEFMGETIRKDGKIALKDKEPLTGQCIVYPKYHTSWDWLMPVVEKIGMLHMNEWMGEFRPELTSFLQNEIEFVYQEVVQFLEGRNKRKANVSVLNHTPGPWIVRKEFHYHAYSVLSFKGDRLFIANCPYHGAAFPGPNTDEYEAAANARLISAAPNLLNSLSRIIEKINTDGLRGGFLIELRNAEEAIKIATHKN